MTSWLHFHQSQVHTKEEEAGEPRSFLERERERERKRERERERERKPDKGCDTVASKRWTRRASHERRL